MFASTPATTVGAPILELRIAMGAPRVIGAVVVCLGKALLGPFGL